MNFYFIASRQKYGKKRSTLLPSTFNKINHPLIIFHIAKVLLKYPDFCKKKKRKKIEGS